jgi:hypothetical protein
MKLLSSLLFVVLLSGCGSLDKNYIDADNDTYNEVAPRVEKLMHGEKLTEEDSKDFKRLMNSWKVRVTTAKKSVDSGH